MLTIRLFGEFHLTHHGLPVMAVNQSRLQSLLTYLLLHRHAPQSRQHLAFLFWPDTNEAQARANLRQVLHLLQQALPAAQHFLLRDSQTLQWRPDAPYTLDVAVFADYLAQAEVATVRGDQEGVCTALAAAVALYQGDLLPACYDDWIITERAQWRERFLTALETLLLHCEAQGHYTAAISYAQRLLQHDPLHESTYRHLMRLYALNGERASALHTYHTCVSLLQRELAVEPHPATKAIYTRLLDEDTAQPSILTGAVHPASRLPLVGRGAEWATLQAIWRKAMHQGAHFVLIAGAAGIGKSRLAEEMRHWVDQQGMTTAYARSYAAEGDMAYAPVVEWLQNGALQATLPQLDKAERSEIARLLPQLRAQSLALSPLPAQPERWQRRQLFAALAHTFLLTKSPLLLIIDDLQWCDQETLEWLHYLLRVAVKTPLVIMGTVRAEEVDEHHPLSTLLLYLRISEQVTEIELGPLDKNASDALARQTLAQPLSSLLAAQLYQASEGNPLFVVEMARAVASWDKGAPGHTAMLAPPPATLPLPPKVLAVIQSRLHQLSQAARELMELAAIMGRAFSGMVLARASDQDEATLIRGLDELWRKRIIREQGADTYDFSHDRLRDVADAGMSMIRRRFLHKRVAQALVALHGEQMTALSGQVAFHYEQAQQWAEAVRYYRQAAEASAARFAFPAALAYLEDSLTSIAMLPNSVDYGQEQIACWLQIAQLLIITQGWTAPERSQALTQAYQVSQQLADKQWFHETLHELRMYYANRGEWHTSFRYAQEALHVAQAMHALPALCLAYQGMGSVHLQRGDFSQSLDYYRRSLALEAHLATTYQPQVSTRARTAKALWLSGYPEQAQIMGANAIRLADEQQHPLGRVHAREFVMYIYQWLGDIATVSQLSAEIRLLAEQFGFPNYALAEQIISGWVLAQTGAYQAGMQQIEQAIAALEEQQDRFHRPHFLALLAQVQVQNGQITQALQTIAQAQQIAEESGDYLWQAELVRLEGEFRQFLPDEREAVAALYRAALAIARRQEAKSLELRAAISLARLAQTQHKTRPTPEKDDDADLRLLAEVYGWFTEGFDTVDLKSAAALLQVLPS